MKCYVVLYKNKNEDEYWKEYFLYEDNQMDAEFDARLWAIDNAWSRDEVQLIHGDYDTQYRTVINGGVVAMKYEIEEGILDGFGIQSV